MSQPMVMSDPKGHRVTREKDSSMKTLADLQALHKEGKLAGIYDDIPIDVYHHPECPGVSNSFLTEFSKSPAHGMLYLKQKNNEQTPAMALGSAVHTACLEPAIFESFYAKVPEGCSKASKDGKAWYAEMESKGIREFLKQDQYDTVMGMVKNLRTHRWASKFLDQKEGLPEQTVFWIDPATGILCKARPDFIRNDGVIIDLKTTKNANISGYFDFKRTVYNARYFVQGAYFLDGVRAATKRDDIKHFTLIAVESEAPFGIRIYILSERALEKGRQVYQQNLRDLLTCTKTNDWKSYPEEPIELDLPEWAYSNSDEKE